MRETIVGLVFFALVGLLLGVTLYVNDASFLRGGPAATLTARFEDVGGLKKGDEVWVYGTKAGRVESIEPDGTGEVEVVMVLDYDPSLRRDYTLTLKPSSALGGMVAAIHPGTPEEPPYPGGPLVGTVVASGLEGITDKIEEYAKPFRETFTNLEKLTADVNKGQGVLGRLVYDDELAGRVEQITRDFSDLSSRMSKGNGTLMKLFTDDKLHKDLEEAVAQFKQLATDANQAGGAIDVLLHDKEFANNLKESGERFASMSRRLDDPDGPLVGALEDVRVAARNAREVTDQLRAGKGMLGRLVYDEELGDRFDRISRDVAQITGKVRRGEGTVGKLIQDDVLYADLRESLRSLLAGAGDARENAPILTFAGFLFSGF